MRTVKLLTLLLLLLPAAGCKWITALFNGGRGYSEKLICHIDSSTIDGSPIFSPDSRRVVYTNAWRRAVVVDCKEGPHYDDIGRGTLIFSPDSRRVAYLAEVGAKSIVVVDGKEDKPYDAIGQASFIFSPDSRRVAYLAEVGARTIAIVDGREERPYDVIGEELGQGREFIPNGATRRLSSLTFSPDSQRVAYAAKVGGKQAVVVDGNADKPYEAIADGPIFSPDNRRVAYAAKVGGKQVVVVDGKEEQSYDGIGLGSLIFSRDSRRVAYVAKVGGKQVVVLDGKDQKSYDGICADSLIFSPDSQRLAYAAKVGGKQAVVVDGSEAKFYDGTRLRSLIFSPDSRRVAYVARVGEKRTVVVDGKEGKSYDDIGSGSVFSSAVGVEVANGEGVLLSRSLDGTRVGGSIFFSPDSRHMAYAAKVGEKWTVVVDGKEGKQYDRFTAGTTIVFDSAHDLHYLADKEIAKDSDWSAIKDSNRRDDPIAHDIYLVEETFY